MSHTAISSARERSPSSNTRTATGCRWCYTPTSPGRISPAVSAVRRRSGRPSDGISGGCTRGPISSSVRARTRNPSSSRIRSRRRSVRSRTASMSTRWPATRRSASRTDGGSTSMARSSSPSGTSSSGRASRRSVGSQPGPTTSSSGSARMTPAPTPTRPSDGWFGHRRTTSRSPAGSRTFAAPTARETSISSRRKSKTRASPSWRRWPVARRSCCATSPSSRSSTPTDRTV